MIIITKLLVKNCIINFLKKIINIAIKYKSFYCLSGVENKNQKTLQIVK